MEILQAATEIQLNHARALMRAFVELHGQCHSDDLPLIQQYIDGKAFEDELAALPGKYAPEKGRLLLAYQQELPAGCVALREIDEYTCEMKHMYVYPQFHGQGIGRILAGTLIDQAKSVGYTHMRLDSGPNQIETQRFYHSLGFIEITPYYELPEALEKWLVFMELDLIDHF